MMIDLSVKLNTETPAFPGDPQIAIVESASIGREGYLGHELNLGTHTGTHIDAPAHMLEGHKTIDAFKPETFVGRGRCIDVRGGFDLQTLEAAGIQTHDIVLFYTGMGGHFYEPRYFTDYPVMSSEAAEYLADKNVKMVGLDTCSADNADGFPVHKILLGNEILIIENLMNLEMVTGKDFMLYALPLNLGLDGAPARVFAGINQ